MIYNDFFLKFFYLFLNFFIAIANHSQRLPLIARSAHRGGFADLTADVSAGVVLRNFTRGFLKNPREILTSFERSSMMYKVWREHDRKV